MGDQLPTIGRIVHYYSGAGWGPTADSLPDHGPFAAIVVDPEPTTCTLRVYDRDGQPHVRRAVKYDPAKAPMSWSWPPRIS